VQVALVGDGGAVVVQKLYHNFKAFRIFDLSDHKLSNHALLVSAPPGALAPGGCAAPRRRPAARACQVEGAAQGVLARAARRVPPTTPVRFLPTLPPPPAPPPPPLDSTSTSLQCHPMALQRLASFFQEQHLHQSASHRRKPVVLVGPRDAATGRCLIVGYQVAAPGRGNKLGAAFEAAAEEVGAQAWHDLFDTAIMEVAAEDVERFKGELLRVATELLY
jgi:hypothetical protein